MPLRNEYQIWKGWERSFISNISFPRPLGKGWDLKGKLKVKNSFLAMVIFDLG